MANIVVVVVVGNTTFAIAEGVGFVVGGGVRDGPGYVMGEGGVGYH